MLVVLKSLQVIHLNNSLNHELNKIGYIDSGQYKIIKKNHAVRVYLFFCISNIITSKNILYSL